MKLKLLGLFALLALVSCNNNSLGSFVQKNNAISKLNQVVIVAEDDVLASPSCDTLENYLTGFFPLLPQPEPYFDIRKYSLFEIENQPILREAKVYIVLHDLSRKDGLGEKIIGEDLGAAALRDDDGNVKIAKDKWAYGQIIIYLYANGPEKLDSLIKASYPTITSRIDQHYDKQVSASVYFNKPNAQYRQNVQNKHGIDMKIPNGWIEANGDENTSWYRLITEKGSHNILIHNQPYTDQDIFKRESIKRNLNAIGKNTISSQSENSYLQLNDWDLPLLLYTKEIDGQYAKEARGIWEMVNDYMGGPYVAYTILDEEQNQVITLFGFIFEPGKDKRDNMIKLNHILLTTNF